MWATQSKQLCKGTEAERARCVLLSSGRAPFLETSPATTSDESCLVERRQEKTHRLGEGDMRAGELVKRLESSVSFFKSSVIKRTRTLPGERP